MCSCGKEEALEISSVTETKDLDTSSEETVQLSYIAETKDSDTDHEESVKESDTNDNSVDISVDESENEMSELDSILFSVESLLGKRLGDIPDNFEYSINLFNESANNKYFAEPFTTQSCAIDNGVSELYFDVVNTSSSWAESDKVLIVQYPMYYEYLFELLEYTGDTYRDDVKEFLTGLYGERYDSYEGESVTIDYFKYNDSISLAVISEPNWDKTSMKVSQTIFIPNNLLNELTGDDVSSDTEEIAIYGEYISDSLLGRLSLPVEDSAVRFRYMDKIYTINTSNNLIDDALMTWTIDDTGLVNVLNPVFTVDGAFNTSISSFELCQYDDYSYTNYYPIVKDSLDYKLVKDTAVQNRYILIYDNISIRLDDISKDKEAQLSDDIELFVQYLKENVKIEDV